MKCPGQDMQYWTEQAIFDVDCPECGHAVEFYQDDTARKCGHCGHRFANPKMDFGCSAYCQFAEQCLGTLPEELKGAQQDLLKDKVAVAVKRYYHTDFKGIAHVMRVARHAEKIGVAQKENLSVVLCAAYLFNVGAVAAMRNHGSTDAQLIKEEGVAVAQDLLGQLGVEDNLCRQICDVLGYQPESDGDMGVYNIVHDAQIIAELEQAHEHNTLEPAALTDALEKRLRTPSAQQYAAQLLC